MERVPVHAPDEAWEEAKEGTEALLDAWLLDEGEYVIEGQPIATIVVVKTTFEVVAPVSGRLAEVRVETGGTFRAGEPIAVIALKDAASL